MSNPFTEFAYYVGRVLLEAFVAWWAINPQVTEDQGHQFALFVSKHFKDVYLKNGTILEALELSNPVDPTTLFQSIFYGSKSSRYYQVQNLAADTTFIQLFKEKGEVNCTYHPMSCSVYDDLVVLKTDFPISRDLFDAQWNSNLELINPQMYSSPQEISKVNLPKAQKVLVTSTLEVKKYPSKDYGFSRMGSDVHIISATNDYSLTSVSEQPFYSQETTLGPEEAQYFNFYQEEEGFYPYNANVYNVSSTVELGGKTYELGDRWFTNQEQVERGGYSPSYNGLWIYGLLNEGTIAENLTEFATCLANSSYTDCVKEYLPWYQDCPPSASPEEKRACSFIKRNANRMQKRVRRVLQGNVLSSPTKEPSRQLLINTYIMIGMGALCVVLCIIGMIILKERKNKNEEGQTLLQYTN